MSNIQLTTAEKIICLRAHRLSQLVTVEGYQDVKLMLQEIETEALDALEAYDGDDEHKTACLAFQWKTAKAVREKLLGRITQRIKAGEQVALSKVPAELLNRGEDPATYQGVRPQCDVDAETEAEETETVSLSDAPPKPPIEQPGELNARQNN
jgi:hypothetical protein